MVRRLLPIAVLFLLAQTPCTAGAQGLTSGGEHRVSRVDLYAGYSWLHPINSGIAGYPYKDINNPAATLSLSYYFNRYIGMQVEGGYFSGENQHRPYNPNCSSTSCDQINYTGEGGLIFRYPLGPFVPFVHTLGGGERYNGPVDNPLKWGWGVTGGVGVDYVLPWFNEHVAIRPVQADWQYSQVVYGPLVLPAGTVGGFGELSAVKLSGGLVLRLGDSYAAPTQLALGCTAQPTEVFAGDPITVTSSTIGFNEKHDANYRWNSNGGSLRPQDNQVTIDTIGMQPGQYTVIGHVTQGSKARHQASCEAIFTVRAMLPPAVRCSANPSTAEAGRTVTISATGTSPENRVLTYSYGASGGSVLGSGTFATLNTEGVAPGSTVTVNCNVVDDLGQHATATADVMISAAERIIPVIPRAPISIAPGSVESSTATLCSVSFARDRKRPTRVDNEGKACLDDIALSMGRQIDAQLIMVGGSDPAESTRAAQERAANAKRYLVTERGIDPGRIVVRVGQRMGRVVENTLVPAGTTYDDPSTTLYKAPQTTSPATTRRSYRSSGVGSMSGVSLPPADDVVPATAPTSSAPGTIPPLQ